MSRNEIRFFGMVALSGFLSLTYTYLLFSQIRTASLIPSNEIAQVEQR
jgi:hypothetical protein